VDSPKTDSQPLDESLRLEIARRAKRQIRARMKALRQSYPASALSQRSAQICERLSELEVFQNARSVAFFWPLIERGEVDVRPLFHASLERGVKAFFPFMDRMSEGRTLTGFRQVNSESELSVRAQSFHEPPEGRPAAVPGDVDLVIVPALAADTRGHRTGYGAGYYDATLRDVAPPAKVVIVVYGFQLMAELPTEAHDIPADYVVTEKKIWPALSSD
jgi:5-formyltetrahydrofolate cyclo-ligase